MFTRMRIKVIFACCAVLASASILGGACGGRTIAGVDGMGGDPRDGGEDAFSTGGRGVVQPGTGGRATGGTGGRSSAGGSGGASCSSSQTSCGGSCVYLASDTTHCGSCFNECATGYSCV